MRLNGIAIALLTGPLAASASAQTAIQQAQADVIANVTQIDQILEIDGFMTDPNIAIVRQTSSTPLQGSNAIEINQFNNGNRAFVLQQHSIDPALFSSQSDNLLNVTQDGFGNTAFGTQFGADNDGKIVQSGDGNIATLGQLGSQLSSEITQTGNGLSAQSIQIGVGAQLMKIHQTGTGAPSVIITRNAQ